jgi:pimeloyl-ACP methyl ester carboxylesterase
MLTRLAHRLLIRRFKAPRLAHHTSPQALGLQAQSVQIDAIDGGHLFGWWIPSSSSSNTLHATPTAVVLHGWGANASLMLPMAPWLNQIGFNALFIDARCHGNSSDAEFTSMPRFAEDLESAQAWVFNQHGVAPQHMVAVGHSVGAGAVLLSASRSSWAGVVSLSAFAHPADMMWRFMREHHIPGKRIGHWVLSHVQSVIGFRFDDIAPENTIQRVQCPVMLVHGANDTEVPLSEAERIQQNAGTSTRLMVVPHVGHDLRPAMQELVPQVTAFLKSVVQ